MEKIRTGIAAIGLRWAECGEWRVLAYADGDYSVNRRVDGKWYLLEGCCRCPFDIERALCKALSVPYRP